VVERMISGFGDFTSSTDSQTSNAEEIEHCLSKCLSRISGLQWALFGKQIGRCGMNRTLKAKCVVMRANLDPTKSVEEFRQRDGGHGSRHPLRTV